MTTAPTEVQAQYEKRLRAYVELLHSTDRPSLWAKWEAYETLLSLQESYGDELWEAAPPLLYLAQSSELDLHMSLARLLESPKRSDTSLFKFLDFCASNFRSIRWSAGELTTQLVFRQKQELESHRCTIDAIMGRRDQYFAHLDKQYVEHPEQVFADYPLQSRDVLKLANDVVMIISAHEGGLRGNAWSGNLSGFLAGTIHNMVATLIEKHRVEKKSK